ncbi:hypothetical protein HGP14_32585 [Rhizobium sp. P32RR-XVIII]|uniref:hypothetical protein n=1 Tax=Rhizobium sp. P32RR-XVIII TaxID=2726738 RepID=UPI0014571D8A|nr:hypothetical protein [Rhizobium sp. P32RR-XVIII]NLS07964.1 hypothetical protein [Rhizobium sp. P32RR-XVIII]
MSWWMFAEGKANGFAAMALAFTVIAANEARVSQASRRIGRRAPLTVAGPPSVLRRVLGSWLRLPFGAPVGWWARS